jgi:hypothetical protein
MIGNFDLSYLLSLGANATLVLLGLAFLKRRHRWMSLLCLMCGAIGLLSDFGFIWLSTFTDYYEHYDPYAEVYESTDSPGMDPDTGPAAEESPAVWPDTLLTLSSTLSYALASFGILAFAIGLKPEVD